MGISKQAIAALKALGIQTTADLDAWIKRHPQEDVHGRYLMSRYGALKLLAGDAAADAILHGLSIQELFT